MFLAAEPSQGAGTRQARLCDLPNQPGLGKIRTFFMMELLERIIGFAAVDGTWLDRMTAGLQKSDLILIAARPSMGKTALALNIAEYAALDSVYAIGGSFMLKGDIENNCKEILKI